MAGPSLACHRPPFSISAENHRHLETFSFPFVRIKYGYQNQVFPTQTPLVAYRYSCFIIRPRNEERRMGKLIAFGWYGGKYSHLDWLLPLLPKATHYCEPFGGSAAVLINREPSPIETYNDVHGEVVNFFRVLRDQKDALV